MIISRRPNKRASNENAPGPRNTIAAVMIPAKIADSLASNRFGIGAGKTENPIPKAPKPTTRPATGVKSPMSNAPPAVSPSRAPSHMPGVVVAFCVR
jgi:hypothetical protein